MAKLGWVVVAIVVATGSARGDDASVEARRHYQEGNVAFSLREFSRAVDEYRAAYKLKQDPAFLYNIAQAYRQAGDLEQALFFYKSYLANSPDAPNRAEVEDRIKKLEAELSQRKAVTTQPPNTPAAPTTAHVAEPTPAAAALTAAPEPREKKPIVKQWWLWTAVGAVAVGTALGVGLGVGLGASAPSSHFGTTRIF